MLMFVLKFYNSVLYLYSLFYMNLWFFFQLCFFFIFSFLTCFLVLSFFKMFKILMIKCFKIFWNFKLIVVLRKTFFLSFLIWLLEFTRWKKDPFYETVDLIICLMNYCIDKL